MKPWFNLPAACFRNRWVFLLLTGLLLAGCQEKTAPVVVVPMPSDQKSSLEIESETWADSVLATMSVSEKIGQLLLIQTPEDIGRSQSLSHFQALCDSIHAGGILLGEGDIDVHKSVTYALQSRSGLPRWMAMNIDDQWADGLSYPRMISLGATPGTSMANEWGKMIGREIRARGAQFCFTPAAKVSPDTFALPGSMGGDPLRVSQKAVSFFEGLRAAGVTACFRTLPDRVDIPASDSVVFPDFMADYKLFVSRDLYPLKQLIAAGLPAAALSSIRVPLIDSTPVPVSPFIAETVVRQGLGFKGIVFSPPLGKYLDQYPSQTDIPEIQMLRAGVEVLVNPEDPAGLAAILQEKVIRKDFSPVLLDEKVRKILSHKYMAGLNSFTVAHPDSFVFAHNPANTEATARLITENAFTVIRNSKRRIPLSWVETEKVASLSIGESRRTPFQREMGHYMDVNHVVMGLNANAGVRANQLQRMKSYKYVLVGLHTPGPRLSPEMVGFLKDAASVTRLVVVNFGSPSVLADLDSLPTVVQVHDNREMTQRSAAQFLFGAVGAPGYLPVQSGPMLCMGDGLPCNKVYRFKYTIPEELNIAPSAIQKVDSILHAALYLGAFPGCQVFAAKDGKVFYHKAFGHQDYSRKTPVRKSDLFDIASITKIAATTLTAMYSYDQDSIKLSGKLKEYIPDIDSAHFTIKDIRVDQLMIHKAGLPSGLPTYGYFTAMDSVDSVKSIFWKPRPDSAHTVRVVEDLYFNENYHDTIWADVCRTKLYNWGKYVYSDMSMFLMKKVLESRHEKRLDRLASQLFYTPLGLRNTSFLPLRQFDKARILPTEEDRFFRKKLVHGYVHDPNAALFGGIGGHAGLFSNAEDLGILFQMLLNGGTYGGRRYISERTVRLFTARYPDSHRGLGFDMQSPGQDYVMCCKSASSACFGHTGFTGTCAWADPQNNIVFIFLSNRVHPSARNQKINIYKIRQNVQQALYDALGIDTRPTLCYMEEPCQDPENPGWVDEDCDVLDSIRPKASPTDASASK